MPLNTFFWVGKAVSHSFTQPPSKYAYDGHDAKTERVCSKAQANVL